VYEVNGIEQSTFEELYPDIWRNGPTDEMDERYLAEVEKFGGRDIYTGLFPGVEDCRRLGWWCRWVDRETGVPL
jgi:hypothetical protein